ncbi:hypothetical protein [Nitrobacter sp. JJSN]
MSLVFAGKWRKKQISSEFVGNLENQTGETGSHLTASATTQSVIFHISGD